MFKTFLALTATLTLTIIACANIKVPFSSIQPLRYLQEDGTYADHCTAWATKIDGMTRWVTAGHCVFTVEDDDTKADNSIVYTIAGKPAHLERADGLKDLALFVGPEASGLTVALGDPSTGDKVYTFAYFWHAKGVFTEGYMSKTVDTKSIFNLTAGPGGSGGPVLTDGNLVVGVMQFTPCPGVCPLVAGSGVQEIREFLYE